MVQVSEISNYLKKEYTGENFLIKEVASFDKIANNSIVFLNDNGQRSIPNVDALVLIPKGFDINGFKCAFIEVENPRLSFARVINKYFLTMHKNKGIHQTCVLGDSCMIDESVSIGPNCVIGDGVVIGANTIINNNVVIFDNVIVGDNCYIKSGAIIGEDGFGFEFEQTGSNPMESDYFELDLAEAKPGRYELRMKISDVSSGEETSRTSLFSVTP